MKSSIHKSFLLSTLVTVLGLHLAGTVKAHVFTTLHSFSDNSNDDSSNFDGAIPYGALVLAGTTLYGTADSGGAFGGGTVFALSTDGLSFANLHSFSNGTDGGGPSGALLLSGNTLYGTAKVGGVFGSGDVFAIKTNGASFTNIHSLASASDGAYPVAGLVLSGSTLYGTAQQGGSFGDGTVFSVNTNGGGFTNLHNFTNNDGFLPTAGLIVSGATLYGTTVLGANGNQGTLFSLNTNGGGFANSHNFTGNGVNPYAGVIQSGGTLYGTAVGLVAGSGGSVFAFNPSTGGFTNLHSFVGGSEGYSPFGGLTLSGNILYGTTEIGGDSDYGTIFAINIDGTGFTTLHSFAGGAEGAYPYDGLILAGSTLYGTTTGGGTSGNGTVFSLVIPPQLNIVQSGTNVVLTWTNTAAGFHLESTTNISPASWNTVSPAAVITAGQYTVTNPISGTHRFYRLSN